jgi:hypothetical protein
MYTEMQMHEVRELTGAAQLRQLSDAELDGISGGGEPVDPYIAPHLSASIYGGIPGTCPR